MLLNISQSLLVRDLGDLEITALYSWSISLAYLKGFSLVASWLKLLWPSCLKTSESEALILPLSNLTSGTLSFSLSEISIGFPSDPLGLSLFILTSDAYSDSSSEDSACAVVMDKFMSPSLKIKAKKPKKKTQIKKNVVFKMYLNIEPAFFFGVIFLG